MIVKAKATVKTKATLLEAQYTFIRQVILITSVNYIRNTFKAHATGGRNWQLMFPNCLNA